MFTQPWRKRIKLSGTVAKGCNGLTLVEMLLVMTVVFLLGAMLFVALAPVREQRRQAACLSNLHQIGQAILLYVNDHAGAGCQGFYGLPPNFASLHPRYVTDLSIFHCPDDASSNPFSYGFHVWRERDAHYISALRRWSVAPDWCQLYNKLGDDFPLVWDLHHTTLSELNSGFRRWLVLFRGGQVQRLITDRGTSSVNLRPRPASATASGP